jgi:RNA polymerase sigma-70 factor (ECF subfamily)
MGSQINSRSKKTDYQETLRSELELWQKICQGDKEAFSSLFNSFYQQLYQFAGRFINDAGIAENIVQDIFATLWIQREQLQITSGLKSYLYIAVKNRALTYRKRNLRYISYEPTDMQKADAAASPEDIYFEHELQTAVHQAIARLPNKCRQVYIMKRYDNLHYVEIAEILNISVNTVKTQLQRALTSLVKQLGPLLK